MFPSFRFHLPDPLGKLHHLGSHHHSSHHTTSHHRSSNHTHVPAHHSSPPPGPAAHVANREVHHQAVPKDRPLWEAHWVHGLAVGVAAFAAVKYGLKPKNGLIPVGAGALVGYGTYDFMVQTGGF